MSGESVVGGSLSAPEDLAPLPELEEIPQVKNVEVWARLKKSSKYYRQGLIDATNSKSRALFWRLEYFTPSTGPGVVMTSLMRDSYCLRFNNNNYRLEDCELYLVEARELVGTCSAHLPKNAVRVL